MRHLYPAPTRGIDGASISWSRRQVISATIAEVEREAGLTERSCPHDGSDEHHAMGIARAAQDLVGRVHQVIRLDRIQVSLHVQEVGDEPVAVMVVEERGPEGEWCYSRAEALVEPPFHGEGAREIVHRASADPSDRSQLGYQPRLLGA